MIHPLLRLVATQPELLADHAQAYAELVSDELGKTVETFKQRIVLNTVGLALMAVALVLAGVALMLWAVVPLANIQAPWALIAAPAVPALVALACLAVGRDKPTRNFVELREQLDADLVMLREVSAK